MRCSTYCSLRLVLDLHLASSSLSALAAADADAFDAGWRDLSQCPQSSFLPFLIAWH